MIKKQIVLLGLLLFGIGTVYAQKTVTGRVTNSNDGQTLALVNVTVKGASVGVITGANGDYSIELPKGSDVLVFSLLGFATKEENVGNRTVVNVSLNEEMESLDDVIVVAYGTSKKSTFTGSAGVVSSEKLERRTATNVTKAIEGTVTGVITTSGSGQPGSGASIRVRGFGSINSSNDPLYVVDGAPYDGSISAINPNDIESVTLLKDAAAGALYGARGANGVVLVTTKRGLDKSDKTQVDVKAKWGVSSRAIPRYDLMNEQEFLEQAFILFRNEQIYKNGVHPDLANVAAIEAMINGTNKMFGENEQYNPYNVPLAQLWDPATGKLNPNAKLRYHENWMDAATKDNPVRQEYDVSVRGGTAKTKYFVSLNYLDEQGILPTTAFQRIGGRLNLDTKAQDWLKFGGNMSFAYNKTDNNGASGTGTANVWYSAQNMAPIYPLHELDSNGKIKTDPAGKALYDYGVNRPAGASPNFNSIALLYDDKYGSRSDNYNISGYTTLDFADAKYGYFQGLNFKVGINLTAQTATSMTYYNPLYGNAGSQQGRLTRSAPRTFSYTTDALLGYNRKFGEHTIDVLAGHEFYAYKYNQLEAQKTGFPFPGIYELNPGATLSSISSYENNYAIESFLSRIKYSYADKYNFDVSFRRDATSRFHEDSRWGSFWSVGANWKASEEDFLKEVSWINNLSVRTSYGVQGNDNLGSLYAWQSFYTLGLANSSYNSSYLASLENKTLQWEKNANFNVGIETRLFDNRLDIVAEFYNRRTYDLLLSVPMATSLGFDSYNSNVGEVNNQGFEFSVGVNIIKSENLEWKVTVLASTVKNKVVKLVSEKPIIGGQIVKAGVPLYSWYRPESAGVDPATGKQLYWVWDKRDPITDERDPESPRYISSDPAKAANSRVVGESRIPDLYGSIGTDLKFFGFDFSFLSTYVLGGKIMPDQYLAYMQPLYVGANFHRNLKRAWQKPGDITDIPMAEYNTTNVTTQSSLVDASYFSIRNITLGYSLPKKYAKKIGTESIRFYLTGDNLVTFNYLDGLDTQASFSNADTYNYVPVRTISAGINISF